MKFSFSWPCRITRHKATSQAAIAVACVFIAVVFARAVPAAAQVEFYVVQAGDSWASIAAGYNVPLETLWRANGVTNPATLAAGQRLFIPDAPSTGKALTFDGTTAVWQIALQSGNRLCAILGINGLDNAAEAAGIGLYAPDRREAVLNAVAGLPSPVAPPTPQPTPDRTPVPGPPLLQSRLGIQGYFAIPELMDQWLSRVTEAGFTWVKYQVDWRLIENPPDVYPTLSTLDAFMDDAQGRHLNVLLSIVKAPDWARSSTEGYGPPTDYDTLTDFVDFLAVRYKPRLDTIQIAFEIWNEPNTSREWAGAPLSAQDYVRLLAGAYVAIKAEDARYTVISAGLAPTGVNDGINSIDDRTFLRQMYQADLARVTDAVGVHPYGWANPPWLKCCGDPNSPLGYDNHPSFFFQNTIEDYRAIQAEYNDTNKKLWVTEFGWGTMEGTGAAIPANAPYFASITQQQQAQYIWQAYLMAQQWDYMGPMFLWNLNMATIPSVDPESAAYSLFLAPDQPRPAYILLRDAPKDDR